MSKAVFVDKSPAFFSKHEAFKDMVLGHMAIDIERSIKLDGRTPVDKGDLKAETRSFRSPSKRDSYRVEADKEYAAVQEKGYRAGSRVFTNYTTPGTGAGWFQLAINRTLANKRNYIDEARRALNL